MRIGIVGFGGVGKAFLNLIDNKATLLAEENIYLKVNYIVDIYGGVYNPNGINLKEFIQFLENDPIISDIMSIFSSPIYESVYMKFVRITPTIRIQSKGLSVSLLNSFIV